MYWTIIPIKQNRIIVPNTSIAIIEAASHGHDFSVAGTMTYIIWLLMNPTTSGAIMSSIAIKYVSLAHLVGKHKPVDADSITFDASATVSVRYSMPGVI